MNFAGSGMDKLSGHSDSPSSGWRSRYSLVFLTDLFRRAKIFPFTMRLSSSVQGTPGSDKERQRKDNKRVGNNMAVISPELSNLVTDAGLYIVILGDGQVELLSLNKQ